MAPKRIRESPQTRRTRPRSQLPSLDEMFATLPMRINPPPSLQSIRLLQRIDNWNLQRNSVGNRPPQHQTQRLIRWTQNVQNLYRLNQILRKEIDDALENQIIPTGNDQPRPPPPPPPPGAGGANVIFA